MLNSLLKRRKSKREEMLRKIQIDERSKNLLICVLQKCQCPRRQSLRYRSRLKETKKSWELNEMCEGGRVVIEGIIRTIGKACKWTVY